MIPITGRTIVFTSCRGNVGHGTHFVECVCIYSAVRMCWVYVPTVWCAALKCADARVSWEKLERMWRSLIALISLPSFSMMKWTLNTFHHHEARHWRLHVDARCVCVRKFRELVCAPTWTKLWIFLVRSNLLFYPLTAFINNDIFNEHKSNMMKTGLNSINLCPHVCGSKLHVKRIHIKNDLTLIERSPSSQSGSQPPKNLLQSPL